MAIHIGVGNLAGGKAHFTLFMLQLTRARSDGIQLLPRKGQSEVCPRACSRARIPRCRIHCGTFPTVQLRANQQETSWIDAVIGGKGGRHERYGRPCSDVSICLMSRGLVIYTFVQLHHVDHQCTPEAECQMQGQRRCIML